MREVKSSADSAKSRVVKENIVTCQHVTMHKPSGKFYALTTSFDFTEVAHERLLRLAAETLLIRWRIAFKNADKVDDTADNQMVEVADLRTAKPRFTKAQKAVKAFGDLSPEEKTILLEKLMGEIANAPMIEAFGRVKE